LTLVPNRKKDQQISTSIGIEIQDQDPIYY